jgi:hypothetical protein
MRTCICFLTHTNPPPTRKIFFSFIF